jgi:hypothetical protein
VSDCRAFRTREYLLIVSVAEYIAFKSCSLRLSLASSRKLSINYDPECLEVIVSEPGASSHLTSDSMPFCES